MPGERYIVAAARDVLSIGVTTVADPRPHDDTVASRSLVLRLHREISGAITNATMLISLMRWLPT